MMLKKELIPEYFFLIFFECPAESRMKHYYFNQFHVIVLMCNEFFNKFPSYMSIKLVCETIQ